jgi:hypothetical protein
MEMTKHTPGPWRIAKFDGADKWIEVIEPSVRVDYDDVDHKTQKANARLIAAAPELGQMLLEELEDLDCWLRDESVSDDTKSAMLIREDKIHRLLGKAGLLDDPDFVNRSHEVMDARTTGTETRNSTTTTANHAGPYEGPAGSTVRR